MKKVLVYDWPTRVFHWLFAGLFVGAFFIAKTFDDDSAVYPVHMMFGMTLSFLVFLRLIWGFVGSKFARFSGFSLSPQGLASYFKQMLTSKTERQLGHNPASSWAALVMMGLALGLACTGLLMAQDISKDFFEEIHELFANAFIVVALAHVGGIIFHTIRHRELIGLSMVTGEKDEVSGQEGISKSHAFVGFVFALLVAGFGANLYRGYDSTNRQLVVFGKTLQLGENEGGEKGSTENSESSQGHDDGDDD